MPLPLGGSCILKKIFICVDKNSRAEGSRRFKRYSLIILIDISYHSFQQTLQTFALSSSPIFPPYGIPSMAARVWPQRIQVTSAMLSSLLFHLNRFEELRLLFFIFLFGN